MQKFVIVKDEGEPSREVAAHLGQFKSRVRVDGISQLLLQCTLPLVVGQLEEVKARRRSGQSVDRVLAANGEEAPQH